MRRYMAVVSSLVLAGATVFGTAPKIANAAVCTKVEAWTDHVPQSAASGAKMYWTLRTLVAGDWAARGFAAEVLWVGTNSQQADTTWVEVGATKGWQGLNQYDFYSANAINGGGYAEAKFVMAPSLGSLAYFRGYKTAANIYRTEVTQGSTTESIAWGGHAGDTVNYSGGLESTCQTNRVDRTYVSENSFLRKSDGLWINISNGVIGRQDPGTFLGWCVQPRTFRYFLNNAIGDACA